MTTNVAVPGPAGSTVESSRPTVEHLALWRSTTLGRVRAQQPEDVREVTESFDEALAVARTFDDALIAASDDPNLSPVGRAEAGREAAAAARAAVVEQLERPLAELEARIRREEARVLASDESLRRPDGMSEFEWALLKSETRAELRRLDPLERDSVAATTDDPLVLAALGEAGPVAIENVGAPGHRFMPFSDPEKLAAARARRARAVDPAGARLLDQLGRFAELRRSLAATLRTRVDERVGAEPAPMRL